MGRAKQIPDILIPFASALYIFHLLRKEREKKINIIHSLFIIAKYQGVLSNYNTFFTLFLFYEYYFIVNS